MIVEGTLDGLDAARARGRVGGRKPKLTGLQIVKAREMYAETGPDGKRRHTVAEIGEVFGVSRKTIYRHLEPGEQRCQPDKSTRTDAPVTVPAVLSIVGPQHLPPAGVVHDPGGLRPKPARIRQDGEPPTVAEFELQQREKMRATRCPTCGSEPVEARARFQQRQDLAVIWLYNDAVRPGEVWRRSSTARSANRTSRSRRSSVLRAGTDRCSPGIWPRR
jgi:hypothetical protein